MRSKTEPSHDTVGLLLDLVARLRQNFATVALTYDLTPPQMGVLTTLDDSSSMGSLASHIGCDASNITWITDRLEERGLVERRADPADRRVKRLVLTDKGRRLRRDVERRLRSEIPGVGKLSSGEQDTLGRLLARILEPV